MRKNDKINGIEISRYIASWYNAGGGKIYYSDKTGFSKWLKTLTFLNIHGNAVFLSDDDIEVIVEVATSGQFELENRARDFIKHEKESVIFGAFSD